MTISTSSISSAVIKRAIQRGQKSCYSWITLSHKTLSGSLAPQHNKQINDPIKIISDYMHNIQLMTI